MSEFVESPSLIVLRRAENVRMTKQSGHEDYSVWIGGSVRAQGGKEHMNLVFDRLTKAEPTP